MKRVPLSILAIAAALSVFGQSPYQLHIKSDALLLGSGVLVGGISMILQSQITPLTIHEIEALDVQDINRFDRSATEYFSGEAYRRSNIGEAVPTVLSGVASFVLPVFSNNEKSFGSEMGTLLLLWTETNLVSLAGTHLTKNLVKRIRPYVYNPEVAINLKQMVKARQSFLSGHTVISAANSFYLAKVFSDYFPQSRVKPYVWGLAAAIPAWTGIERYLSGRHFPTDVIAGYAFGALCGYFIPHMHKSRTSQNKTSLGFYPFSSGYGNGLQMVLNF